MLPHKHFLISGAAMAPFALHDPAAIAVSGLVSACVDIDIVTLVWVYSRKENSLKEFRNPIAVFTRFEKFMRVIADTGVLRAGMRTHFGMFTLFLVGAWLFFPHYFTAVTVGVVTHLLTDIPHLKRELRSQKRRSLVD